MSRIRAGLILGLALVSLLGGCGSRSQSPPPAVTWDDPGFVSAGPWSLYYSAFAANDLPRELAKEYGVASNPSGALVVVSLGHADHRPVPLDARVTITVRTLSGSERAVAVRRVERNGAVSWLGEFSASRREMLLFTVTGAPDPQAPPIKAEFRRELYLD